MRLDHPEDLHGELQHAIENIRGLWNGDPSNETRGAFCPELYSAARGDINTLLGVLQGDPYQRLLAAEDRATAAEGWLRTVLLLLRQVQATPAIAAALTVYGNAATGVPVLEVLEEIADVPQVALLLPAVEGDIPALQPLRGDDLATAGVVAQAIVDAHTPAARDDDAVPASYYEHQVAVLPGAEADLQAAEHLVAPEAEDAWGG